MCFNSDLKERQKHICVCVCIYTYICESHLRVMMRCVNSRELLPCTLRRTARSKPISFLWAPEQPGTLGMESEVREGTVRMACIRPQLLSREF